MKCTLQLWENFFSEHLCIIHTNHVHKSALHFSQKTLTMKAVQNIDSYFQGNFIIKGKCWKQNLCSWKLFLLENTNHKKQNFQTCKKKRRKKKKTITSLKDKIEHTDTKGRSLVTHERSSLHNRKPALNNFQVLFFVV